MSFMDEDKFNKLLEDISYMRGRFDTIVPEIQKNAENTNTLLQLHNERIASVEKEQLALKAKVGVFGAMAGVFGGIVINIVVSLINKKLF